MISDHLFIFQLHKQSFVMISDFVRLFYHPEETLDTSHLRLNIIKMKKKEQKDNRITRKIKNN